MSSDTGGYCKAHQRLPEMLLRRLGVRVGETLSSREDGGNLWFGRRVLAADGSSFSMPDTSRNQGKYPQPSAQKPVCGFPVAGFVAVICLATGALLGAALRTCNTHDMVLFYYVRACFLRGDIFLGDHGFSSYAEMALFLERGVDSVVRLHQRRRTDFRRGKVLGVDDHIETWVRPCRNLKDLRAEDYVRSPETLQMREIRYRVDIKGYRTNEITLSTTLLGAKLYPAKALADLYFRRWRIEVDFRHLKTTTQLDVCRGKSPNLVEKEFWVHVLSYNLTRSAMWDAGDMWDGTALGLSLKGAIQHLLSRWVLYWTEVARDDHDLLPALINVETVPCRAGRVEPRVKNRRAKHFSLMTQPRRELKKRLPIYHC